MRHLLELVSFVTFPNREKVMIGKARKYLFNDIKKRIQDLIDFTKSNSDQQAEYQ